MEQAAACGGRPPPVIPSGQIELGGEFVISNLFRSALILAAVSAPIAASASEPPAPSERARDRAHRSDSRAQRQAEPELICRSVEVAGSRGAMPMVCMSAADWERAEQ